MSLVLSCRQKIAELKIPYFSLPLLLLSFVLRLLQGHNAQIRLVSEAGKVSNVAMGAAVVPAAVTW